jgi:hypothetical protein
VADILSQGIIHIRICSLFIYNSSETSHAVVAVRASGNYEYSQNTVANACYSVVTHTVYDLVAGDQMMALNGSVIRTYAVGIVVTLLC